MSGNSTVDIGNKTISSLNDDPKSESDSVPVFNGEIAYTFSNARTQIFLGNQFEDFIEFDLSAQLGVKHELTDKSLIAVGYLFSTIPTEVWEDPYLTNQARSKTDRDSTGIRLEWDRIAGTTATLKYTYRDISLDDELSGQLSGLGLTAGDIKLLDREGKKQHFEGSYRFDFNNGHSLRPKLSFAKHNLDGDAMSNDVWAIGVTHIYDTTQYSLITNIDLASTNFDKTNPIFNKTRDDDRWGGTFTAAYKNAFGIKNWNLLGTAAYFHSDSNIDFYDTTVSMLSITALRRFK
ncbi:MAG: DUF2860 domain-containing protein [Gammaproteobacteria bacterium]|nr:MAG: DUF2860 domain-containing protein [Gammaproteobacteria bacterium]